jgi:hypothetical protein
MQLPFPPPGGPVELPGPVGEMSLFCVLYFVLLGLVLLTLPKAWMRKIIRVAFHVRGERMKLE